MSLLNEQCMRNQDALSWRKDTSKAIGECSESDVRNKDHEWNEWIVQRKFDI